MNRTWVCLIALLMAVGAIAAPNTGPRPALQTLTTHEPVHFPDLTLKKYVVRSLQDQSKYDFLSTFSFHMSPM